MKTRLVALVFVLLLLGLSNKGYSQYYFSVHLGPAASSRNLDFGWNAGIQLSRSVLNNGWGVYVGLDAINDGQGSGLGDFYLSISTGVTYSHHVSNNFGLLINTGLLAGYSGYKFGAGILLFENTSVALNFLGPFRNDNGVRIIALSVGYKFKI